MIVFFKTLINFSKCDNKCQSRYFQIPRRPKASATTYKPWTHDETRLCTGSPVNKARCGLKRTINRMTPGGCHDSGNAHAKRKRHMPNKNGRGSNGIETDYSCRRRPVEPEITQRTQGHRSFQCGQPLRNSEPPNMTCRVEKTASTTTCRHRDGCHDTVSEWYRWRSGWMLSFRVCDCFQTEDCRYLHRRSL